MITPVTLTFVTFAAVGIGKALPYLFLSNFPTLTSKMPKAGPASELKENLRNVCKTLENGTGWASQQVYMILF